LQFIDSAIFTKIKIYDLVSLNILKWLYFAFLRPHMLDRWSATFKVILNSRYRKTTKLSLANNQ